jgi:predicted phosphodiesterase
MSAPCVKGNHDEYCSDDIPLKDFRPAAAKAIEWTRKQLTADDRLWLKNLPYLVKLENFTMVHSTLNQPNRWRYVFDNLGAAASFEYQDHEICFYGHTHLPLAFIRDQAQVRGGTFSKISIEKNKLYYVNSGSVGQPRDVVGKAAYVIYDVTKQMVELRRVDFDHNETVRKMRQAGLC